MSAGGDNIGKTLKTLIDTYVGTLSTDDKKNWPDAVRLGLQEAIGKAIDSFCPPIGSIIAWHKSLTGIPSLPSLGTWQECDGSIISDSDSPMNGQTIPNLNGDARFLRGASNSGTLQTHSTENLYAQIYFGGAGNAQNRINTPSWTSNIVEGVTAGGSVGAITLGTKVDKLGTGETYPKNMSIVWIIRIK